MADGGTCRGRESEHSHMAPRLTHAPRDERVRRVRARRVVRLIEDEARDGRGVAQASGKVVVERLWRAEDEAARRGRPATSTYSRRLLARK